MQPTPGEPTAPTPYVDPKTIRFGPATTGLYWTSKGARPGISTRLYAKFIRRVYTTGAFHRALPALPALPQFNFTGTPGRGPLGNATYKNLAHPFDGNDLWLLLENPPRQDWPASSPADAPYPSLS